MSNIFPGDEGVIRVKVKDTRGDHVLVDSVNLPVREFWFPASYFERTAQGAASADNEKRAATSEPATLAGTAVAVEEAPASLKDQAIAHVMSKGYDRVAAEKIVEEVGTKTILADRDDETSERRRAQQEAARASLAGAATTADPGNQNKAQTPPKPPN